MRILIDYILPLVAPTLLWLTWLGWKGHRARRAGLVGPGLQSVPISWLAAAGFVLAMLVAVSANLRGGYATGGYQPARVDETGHLVPGSIR